MIPQSVIDHQRKQESEAKMLARMQEGRFRFRDLWMPLGDGYAPEYREADRLIQRERKAGRIRQVERGVWEVVK